MSHCAMPIALISDSTRVIGELQHNAGGLTLVHCCSQPVHVNAAKRKGEFPMQVCLRHMIAWQTIRDVHGCTCERVDRGLGGGSGCVPALVEG